MDTAEVAEAARREDSAARIIDTRMEAEEVAAEDLEDPIAEADIDKEEAVMAVEDGLDTEEEVAEAGADLQEPGAGEREETTEDPPMIGGNCHPGTVCCFLYNYIFHEVISTLYWTSVLQLDQQPRRSSSDLLVMFL